MEDYPGSLAQGAVLFSDSVDWEEHAGAVQVTHVDVAKHCEMLDSDKAANRLAAARAMVILSSEGQGDTLDVHSCRTEIVAAGGHAALLKFLSTEVNEDLAVMLTREAATAALCNLCAQDDSRALVASAGGIPILVALATGWSRGQNLSEELMAFACGALGNLARDNQVCQDEIAAAGGIPALIALAQAAGIEEVNMGAAGGAAPVRPRGLGDEDDDTGLELNASIALRKLAINNSTNYEMMKATMSADDLKYFLHGQLPSSS